MVELILMVATLAIVIMAWSKISKALDWTGARIGETGDMFSDLTVSGSKQTARGVIISHDSLLDTALESKKKNAKRRQDETAFTSKLKEDEKKDIDIHATYLDTLIKR